MFSESVSPPSWKPVTSCRNDLIAVCWAHTNQGIDMCTLSLYSGNRQSLQSCNAFSPLTIVKLHNTVCCSYRNATDVPSPCSSDSFHILSFSCFLIQAETSNKTKGGIYLGLGFQ